MFRKLYFITEQTDSQGQFHATGVYTSIHDLIDSGLRWVEPAGSQFRISLVKLDSRSNVLCSWESPDFEGLETKIQQFVNTGEFGVEEMRSLRSALTEFATPVRA